MKKTTSEIIRDRKIKQQSPLISGFLRLMINPLYNWPCSVKYIRHVDMKKYRKEPLLVLVNHASRFDYAFVQGALGKRKYNFVAAEEEFHRTKFKTVFKLGHAIPKKSFVPDLNAIRGVKTILTQTKNGCVAICPCGLSTVSGAQQPIIPGVGKMVKHFGVRVLAIRIHGAYLVCPKFDLKERKGHVEVELDELFSPEDLAKYTAEELDLKIDQALFTDDYEFKQITQTTTSGTLLVSIVTSARIRNTPSIWNRYCTNVLNAVRKWKCGVTTILSNVSIAETARRWTISIILFR